MKTNILFFIILALFLLQLEMFQANVVEEIKTHLLRSVTSPHRKSCPLQDKVEKYYRAGQATDDNTMRGHCMLDA